MPVRDLPTGAALRTTGDTGAPTVLCLNGGSGGPVPGDWSPSMELLVDRLAPRFPGLAFTEVRYRIKSWRALGSCIADGRAALDAVAAAGAPAVCLLGFSMGGAVAVAIADHPCVRQVVGLAPWVPDELDLGALRGRRVRVLHGSVDGFLPGIPGVSPRHSRAAVARMRAHGLDAAHTTLRGAVHGIALRPFGVLTPLPRAGAWTRGVARELGVFAAGDGPAD